MLLLRFIHTNTTEDSFFIFHDSFMYTYKHKTDIERREEKKNTSDKPKQNH